VFLFGHLKIQILTLANKKGINRIRKELQKKSMIGRRTVFGKIVQAKNFGAKSWVKRSTTKYLMQSTEL